MLSGCCFLHLLQTDFFETGMDSNLQHLARLTVYGGVWAVEAESQLSVLAQAFVVHTDHCPACSSAAVS